MITEPFKNAFERTIGLEGGFVDDPKDSGGATKYGITERVAREEGYTGSMRDLDLLTAQKIAKSRYWDLLKLDVVAEFSNSVAEELFDTSFNMGQSTAGSFLQRTLNVFNREQADYPDIVEDGLIGNGTIAALHAFFKKRGTSGELVLMRALNCLQGARYFDIVTRRPKDERFIFGWFFNRVLV